MSWLLTFSQIPDASKIISLIVLLAFIIVWTYCKMFQWKVFLSLSMHTSEFFEQKYRELSQITYFWWPWPAWYGSCFWLHFNRNRRIAVLNENLFEYMIGTLPSFLYEVVDFGRYEREVTSMEISLAAGLSQCVVVSGGYVVLPLHLPWSWKFKVNEIEVSRSLFYLYSWRRKSSVLSCNFSTKNNTKLHL